jgi:hypothetical protein
LEAVHCEAEVLPDGLVVFVGQDCKVPPLIKYPAAAIQSLEEVLLVEIVVLLVGHSEHVPPVP